jgi:hypothetical protein
MFAVKDEGQAYSPAPAKGWAVMDVWSDKQGEEPDADASSDHSLIRGLDTALSWFVAGLARSMLGRQLKACP